MSTIVALHNTFQFWSSPKIRDKIMKFFLLTLELYMIKIRVIVNKVLAKLKSINFKQKPCCSFSIFSHGTDVVVLGI